MVEAAQASIPSDFSWLSGLDPGVAYAALFVVALGMVLFYFGPGLRDRFRKAPPPPLQPPAATGPALPVVPPTLPAAIDQAERVSAQFIAHLQEQVRELERDNDTLRGINARLQTDNERLLWMRGGEGR